MSQTYTTIIIGSSPICLIEALYRSKNNERVLVVEGSDRLGGAWHTFSWNSWQGVECGVHIPLPNQSADVSQRVYDFMEQELGWDLTTITPPPTSWWRAHQFPYESPSVSLIYLVRRLPELVSHLSRGHIRIAAHHVLKSFRMLRGAVLSKLKNKPHQFRYPRGGCAEIIHKLERDCVATGVTIKRKMKVQSFKVATKQKQIILKTDQGTVTGHHLVITSGTRLVDFPVSERAFPHIHLEVTQAHTIAFSQVRLIDHPAIHRIADLTPYVTNSVAAGNKILTALLHPSRDVRDDDKTSREVLRWLKQRNLISRTASIVRQCSTNYAAQSLGPRELAIIAEQYHPYITALYSTELIDSFARQFDRWQTMAAQN